MSLIVGAVLAENEELPPIRMLGYEYVVAANGLFIRAEDSRMEALLPIALADLSGLSPAVASARLKIPRIPEAWLWTCLSSARKHMPTEVVYQFLYDADATAWHCTKPTQSVSSVSAYFADAGGAVVDLHSHHAMNAFFSTTDDGDEQGLRFYAVIGRLNTEPEILVRAGVYGHHWPVPATVIFDGLGPFVDKCGRVEEETEQ